MEMLKGFRLFIVTLVLALLAVAMQSVWASGNLPTSENLATGKWTHMQASSYESTIESALEQCNRTERLVLDDRLTSEKCVFFENKLRDKESLEVSVGDGIVFDYMNGRKDKKSFTTRNVVKKLGRQDQALLYDLGDGVWAYWFVGDKGKSCNNVAFVFTKKPAPPPTTPTPESVAGVCGSNARDFPPEETVWPNGGSFCQLEDSSSAGIVFPVTPGSASQWQCLGKNGGKTVSCMAVRKPPPPLELKCEWVEERRSELQPGQTIYVPSVAVSVCFGQVFAPAIFAHTPNTAITTIRWVKVCK